MCDPVTIATLAISAGSTLVGHQAQASQAKAETKAAQDAYAMDQMQSAEKYRQENDQLNQQMTQRNREAMVERGRLNAAYGESGLEGTSLDRILGENEFNLGQDISTMETNRSNLTAQTRMSNLSSQATAQSRLNSIQRPSMLNTGLQIAGGVLSNDKASGWINKKLS